MWHRVPCYPPLPATADKLREARWEPADNSHGSAEAAVPWHPFHINRARTDRDADASTSCLPRPGQEGPHRVPLARQVDVLDAVDQPVRPQRDSLVAPVGKRLAAQFQPIDEFDGRVGLPRFDDRAVVRIRVKCPFRVLATISLPPRRVSLRIWYSQSSASSFRAASKSLQSSARRKASATAWLVLMVVSPLGARAMRVALDPERLHMEKSGRYRTRTCDLTGVIRAF